MATAEPLALPSGESNRRLVAAVVLFRGVIDLVLRRAIPSVFGKESARLREEDVVARRLISPRRAPSPGRCNRFRTAAWRCG